MWHQREPENFVDRTKGWEAISLPFSADIVTTNDKGEITHFYGGSENSKNGTGTKIGHEYWLRKFTGNAKTENNVAYAEFKYPEAGDGYSETSYPNPKTVTNTFLWDYYYYGLKHNQKDYNTDDYQVYYSTSRDYRDYALLTRATPYVIGFPGATYYEFDLSGNFTAGTTAEGKTPTKLDKQTITFASPTGTIIRVSDQEMDGVSKNGFTFKPNYLNMAFKAGTDNYTLKADNGSNASSFEKVPAAGNSSATPVADTPLAAFRPYFTASTAPARATRSIMFKEGDATELLDPDETHQSADEPGTLSARAGRHRITVKSTLNYTTDVRIVNTAGQTIAKMTLQPGDVIETRVNLSGVYIVQSEDGQFVKKLAVK